MEKGGHDAGLLSSPPPMPDGRTVRDAEAVERWLCVCLGRPVKLRLNTNRTSMVSFRADPSGTPLRVSLHQAFLQAPAEVLAAVGRFIGSRDRDAVETMRAFCDEHPELFGLSDRPVLVPERAGLGRVHDLRALADAENRDRFDGKLEFAIHWQMEKRARRARQSLSLGLCHTRERRITIHPVLDHPSVPVWIVRYVIFHELCHLAEPPRKMHNGMWSKHSPEFKALERRHPDHDRARVWLDRELPKLLKRASHGTPPSAS